MSKQLASRWKRGDEIPVYFDRAHSRIAEVDVYGLRATIGRTEGAT
jgi:Ni/Co efflux regulator RcnB